MIQNLSNIVPADNCGVWLISVIHTYTNLSKLALVGFFTNSSISETNPNNWLSNNNNINNIYVRSSHTHQTNSGISYLSNWNNCVLLNNSLTPSGSNVIGPVDNRVSRNRARASFINVI